MAVTKRYDVTTSNANISGYVEIVESDVSTPNNDSDVTATLWLHRTNIYNGITASYNCYFYITIDGTEYTIVNNGYVEIAGNSSSSGGAYTKVGSATKQNIKHNDDGSKIIGVSVRGSMPYASSGITLSEQSTEVELTEIARASEVSCSSPYIGDNATIIISSASSSFRHTLTYSFGNKTGTIATKTNLTTVPWDTNAIKSDLYAQIPNAKSGSGTITCQTYSGNTLVGTKTCSFNLYAKESDCKPSISGTVIDTNPSTIALTGDSSIMVRYMSKPKVTISSNANYSSSIVSYSINVDGQTTNLSEATYETISSNNITISVADSRGYSNSMKLTPSMISYIKLTSNFKITRPEQTSSEAYLNGSGQWFNGDFSSSNANTLTITCQYRKSGDSNWSNFGTLTPAISGNTFSISNLRLGSSFDYKEEYQFRITVSDKLQTIGSESRDIIILSVGKPIIRISKKKVEINGDIQANVKVVSNCGSDSPNTAGWYKVATQTMSGYGNANLLYYIRAGYGNGYYGLVELEMRSNNDSIQCWKCEWIARSGWNRGDIRVVISGMTWTLYIYNPVYQYGRVYFSEIQHRNINGYEPHYDITYYDSSSPESIEPIESVVPTDLPMPKLHSGNRNTTDTWIPVFNHGYLDYTERKIVNEISNTDHPNNMDFLPTMGFLSFWNGSFNNNKQSNLKYSNEGEIQAKPKVLYDNSSGTTGTVTLSETSANFVYLEIFCLRSGSVFSSGKIPNPNGKSVIITTSQFYSGDNSVYVYPKKVTISGTSITVNYQKWGHLGGSLGDDNDNKIIRVIGYR